MASARPFKQNLDLVRGLAMLFVIAGHSVIMIDWYGYGLLRGFVYSFFKNGSFMFMFISGYVFSYTQENYTYSGYLKKRLVKTLGPYLFALAPILVCSIFAVKVGNLEFPSPVRLLFTGYNWANTSLWFFPMLVLFYLVSPVFNWLNQRKMPLFFIAGTAFIGLMVHRPLDTSDTIHSFLYFLFPYVFGIWSNQNADGIESFLKKYHLVVLGLFLLVLGYQSFKVPGLIFRDLSEVTSNRLVDWPAVQKILLCTLLVFYFDRVSENAKPIEFLKWTASISFGLHLSHQFFIRPPAAYFGYWGGLPVWLFPVAVVVVFLITAQYVLFLRTLTGKYRKYVIG